MALRTATTRAISALLSTAALLVAHNTLAATLTSDATATAATTQSTTTRGTPINVVSLAQLGRQIFFDSSLSNPAGQSCASCHDPLTGFADPRSGNPTSPGAYSGRFGNRNAPSSAYTGYIPAFQFNQNRQAYIGGLFLDGRALNLESQAKDPFFNPLEMNNTDLTMWVTALRNTWYSAQFDTVFGSGALDDPETALERVAAALAAYERSTESAPFTSKYDAVQAGEESFTTQELRGFNLFFGTARCADCHNSIPPAGAPATDTPQVFSDFSFQNIGVPANPNNPFYTQESGFNPEGSGFVDLGLGGALDLASENGKFRVPSLRNVALTAPYMHNGRFATLAEVVQFYNTRDVNPDFTPEVADNVTRRGGIGNMRLTAGEMAALVAFLQTLSDR